jgi:acetyltransferase-like isoleucine patch superfamily enzyme
VQRAKRLAEALGLKPVLSRVRDRSYPASAGGSLLLTTAVGRLPSASARMAVYGLMGLTVGRRAHIYGGMEVRSPGKITIGDGSVVGLNAILDGREGITIGRNVNLSSEVAIWTLQHDPQAADFGTKGGPVVVEDRAWLSFRCTVLPGVTIGEGAVVAAGSIVTKDVAPFAIVAGIPAERIGERERHLTYELGRAPTYWFV